MRVLPALLLSALAVSACAAPTPPGGKIKVLIVDGQSNHNWKVTTPLLKQALEDTGRFAVDVATTPPKDTTGFRPKFADYPVVVSNYNGQPWPAETQKDFEEYVRAGGGFVSVHAADNAFPEWAEYNRMIGLGGWGGRSEKSGPYVRYKDGKVIRDETPGRGGSHGKQHEFVVETVFTEHPITKGLPPRWKHTQDELYDRLRGPAKEMTILAVAFSDKATGGTGENEPVLFTIDYGKGRVFHTTLGHDPKGLACVGFVTTFTRGTEWAATGGVTLPAPSKFPTADESLSVGGK
jgi:type 1 glutamine amidotransferase